MKKRDISPTKRNPEIFQNKKGYGRQLSTQQTQFIETQNHCALCNSTLQIKVESYLEDYTLREEAVCLNCNVKTRVKDHKMQ